MTAACLAAAGHRVIGLDADEDVVANLRRGLPPIHEPGLAELIRSSLVSGTLAFLSDVKTVSDADVVWVCHDTPVDHEDRADIAAVLRETELLFPHLKDRALVLVSGERGGRQEDHHYRRPGRIG